MDSSTVGSLLENVTEKTHGLFTENVAFSWYDYILFTLMLLLSAIIGIYFWCFGKKQDSTNEYLLGGKNMGIFPISMSLISSLISGITLLAVPADIYSYGVQYALCIFSFLIIAFISPIVYYPVFFKCEVTSTFEYLELRFNKKIRKLTSFLYTLQVSLYLPIVIFIPALAFSQATGLNLHYITPVVCSVCIFYTTIGGLKAVVWTDTLQFTAMVGAIVAVIWIGTSKLGGFFNVMEISSRGDRLSIDFDINPFKRETFWSVFIGLIAGWINLLAIQQGSVQKFLALGCLKRTKITMIIFAFGMSVVTAASVYTGLLIYATYSDCDLIGSKKVEKHDQLLPYYVLDIATEVPGLAGLFIAGICCAALSTLSATMNSLAGTIFEDFILPLYPKTTSPKTIGRILKWLVLIIGIVSTALVYVVEHLGGLLPLAISVGAITGGPITGLFTLGMLVPSANTKGALAGSISALSFLLWLIGGSQYYKLTGVITYPPKTMSTEGCENFINSTISFVNYTMTEPAQTEPFILFRISHYYYITIAIFIIFAVGIPVSYLTRNKDDLPVNKDYISPVMHWLVKDEKSKEYNPVSQDPRFTLEYPN